MDHEERIFSVEQLEGRGFAQEKVRTFNRQLILQYLREHGPTSRVDLAKKLGLSRATVTIIVKELMAEDFVREGEKMHGASISGKRATEISFNKEAGYIVAIDLGRSRLRIYLTNLAAEIIDQASERVDTKASWQQSLSDIAMKTDGLVKKNLGGWTSVRGIGMGMPGIGMGMPGSADHQPTMLIILPLLKRWRGVNVPFELRSALNLEPGFPIYIDNDASLGGLGESRYGEWRGVKNMIYIKLSTGIGAGLILNGQLYRGEKGVAGEFGHVLIQWGPVRGHTPVCSSCDKHGCLEAMAGLHAIVHDTKKYRSVDDARITPDYMADIIMEAERGDQDCRAALERAGKRIGTAIGSYLINIYNPALILLDGGIIRPAMGEEILINTLLLEKLRESAREASLPVAWEGTTVTTGTLGDDAVGLGAVATVIDRDPALTLSPLGEQKKRVTDD